jgi:protein-S-isoprenylcysteine O-methyltransferase Ste14
MILRHALSIAILPFTVTILVPVWIAQNVGSGFTQGPTAVLMLIQLLGFIIGLSGIALFVASLRRFATDGQGTLAPWDPPRRLVVNGPYRYVRNPMISGVLFVLIGEALVLRSQPHAVWAVIFAVANVFVITLYEEPHLTQVFGDAYRTYQAHGPRIVPRLSAWQPPDDNRASNFR